MFIHYIEGTALWLPTLDALLDASGRDIQICTSTVSMTEVAYHEEEKRHGRLDSGVEAKIDALFADDVAVKIGEYDRIVARDARALIRAAISHGRSLKTLDAIHVATAQAMGAVELHTMDKRLVRISGMPGLPFSVSQPYDPKPRLLP